MLPSLPRMPMTNTLLPLLSENSGKVFRGILVSLYLCQVTLFAYSSLNATSFYLVKVLHRMPTQRASLVSGQPKLWSLAPPVVAAKKTPSGIAVIVTIHVQIRLWTVKKMKEKLKKIQRRSKSAQQSSRLRPRWTLPTLNPDCRTPACPACLAKNTRPILTFYRVKNQDFLHRYWYSFLFRILFFFHVYVLSLSLSIPLCRFRACRLGWTGKWCISCSTCRMWPTNAPMTTTS